jgi:hypothetical protein
MSAPTVHPVRAEYIGSNDLRLETISPTGGTGTPFTYEWYRGTSSGFTLDNSSRVALARITLKAQPSDGNTIQLTALSGSSATFEFDSNNSVAGSNVKVTIGADIHATIGNLRSAIASALSLTVDLATSCTISAVGVVSGTASGTNIFLYTSGGQYVYGSSVAGINLYDFTVSPATTYYYKLRVKNTSAETADSTEIAVTTYATGVLPMARWAAVPYQPFSSTFNVGIVAGGKYPISSVDFRVNGVSHSSVTSASLNTRTGNTEYFITLAASDYTPGTITVDATVNQTVGPSRIMERLYLDADPVANRNGVTNKVRYVDSTISVETSGITGAAPSPGAIAVGGTSGASIVVTAMDSASKIRGNLIQTMTFSAGTTLTALNSGRGTIITGGTSGAKAFIAERVSGTSVNAVITNGTFSAGETVTWTGVSVTLGVTGNLTEGETLTWEGGSATVSSYARNGSDAWDGTSAAFVSGTTGPCVDPTVAMRLMRDGSNRVDGCVVRAAKGIYAFSVTAFPRPETYDRWVTFEPNVGLSSDDVVLYGCLLNGPNTQLLHIKNQKIMGQYSGPSAANANGGTSNVRGRIWIDGCRHTLGSKNAAQWALVNNQWCSGVPLRYVTDCAYDNCARGTSSCTWVHNTSFRSMCDTNEDSLFQTRISADDIGSSDDINQHPDGSQWNAPSNGFNNILPGYTNVIVDGYTGVNCDSNTMQMWIIGTGGTFGYYNKNWLFRNWTAALVGTYGNVVCGQNRLSMDNWLIENCSWANQKILLGDNGTSPNQEPASFTNLTIRDSTFHELVAVNTGNSIASDPTTTITNTVFQNGTNWNTNSSPSLSISSSPATYPHGSSHSITATATDDEDGSLTASIVWTSDIQSLVGVTGGTLDTATLDVGTHTITATVTDSGGLSSTDTIEITITYAAIIPGTITIEKITPTSVSLSSTAATGGSGTFTYQWHHSGTTGFTPNATTAIGGATTPTLLDGELTASTDYYYVLVYTDDESGITASSDEIHVTTFDALSSGTLEVTSIGNDTISLTSTLPTGGNPPYTYEWHRSTTSPFSPSEDTIVADATTLTLNDSRLTPNTTYYYVLLTTDDEGARITSEEAFAITTMTHAVSRIGNGVEVIGTGDATDDDNWQTIFDSKEQRDQSGPPLKSVWFIVGGTQSVNIRITGLHDTLNGMVYETWTASTTEHVRKAFRGDVGLITKIEVNAPATGGVISWGPKHD